jgi:hypothetical protein
MKSPTTHRQKRKLLEESQAKIFLDLIDVEQGVKVKESTQIMNNMDFSMLAISNLEFICHLSI